MSVEPCSEWYREINILSGICSLSAATIAICALLVIFILVNCMVCWLLLEHEQTLFDSTCDRARLLAAQIMLLHVGAQPPAHVRRGTTRVGLDRRFSKAATEMPEYQNMLRNVFGAITAAEWVRIGTKHDDLIDDRNGFAHPVNDTVIISEAAHLVRTMNAIWRKPRLSANDFTTLEILSRCAAILAAPRVRA